MAEMEVQRNVLNDDGRYVSVRPHPDAPDKIIELCATGNDNQDWFGPISLFGTPEFMRLLGQALIAAADDLTEEDK